MKLTNLLLLYDPTLLFLVLGDLFALISVPLLKRPEVFRANYLLLITSLAVGVLVTVVTGWVLGYQIITPGGGGTDFGYPFPWRLTDQGWFGQRVAGDTYDPISFVVDFFFYSGIVCAVGLASRKLVRELRASSVSVQTEPVPRGPLGAA